MADREKKKVVTKKHLARVEREQIQRRVIMIATITVAAVVVILIGAGFIIEGIIKPSRPIAQVDDTAITTRKFQTWVRYQRYNLVNQYINYWQMKQSFSDANSASFFDSYLYQIDSQLQKEYIGLSAIEALIQDVLVRREAEKLGIEVSQAEVEAWIQQNVFNYYADGTPTPAPTSLIQPTSTLSSLQMTLVAPTATEVVADDIPTATATTEPTAIATITEETNEGVSPTAVPPTATAYTEKALKTDLQSFLRNLKSYSKVSEKDLYEIIESQLLYKKVLEAITVDLQPEEEQVWARHILFQDQEKGEEQAQEFYARIQAGEDFLTLVEEYIAVNEDNPDEEASIRFEDLGWFGKNQMVLAFEQAAYSLDVGEISAPVNTSFGWHIIQVLGHENRPLNEYDFQQMREKVFSEWIAAKRAESLVDIQPDWVDVVPLEPAIPEQIQLSPFQ